MQENIPDRARTLLKVLVERHIRDGQPVGSRTLQEEAGLPVSAATIRNVLSDLEERGFLHSPHTSSGRVPTAMGYRLFVDSLLQVQEVDEASVAAVRQELNPDKSATDLVQSASQLLSAITSQAGIVTVPRQETPQLRQVEFLPLSDNRVLVILVINQREVQNRIIHTKRAFTEEELREAARLVNQRYAGQALDAVKSSILDEMREARSRIDDYLSATLDLASQALQQEESADDYMLAGGSRLLDSATPEDVDKLRELFDIFERKKDLLHLLERCTRADGVRIFIGDEAGHEVFGDFSVITAAYGDGRRPLGVLGVIGPTRMAYERVIPIVDVTSRMLSSALSAGALSGGTGPNRT